MEVKENPKSFWKFIKSKTNIRSGISDLKNENGDWITNDKAKADELNDFLAQYSQRMKLMSSLIFLQILIVLYVTSSSL